MALLISTISFNYHYFIVLNLNFLVCTWSFVLDFLYLHYLYFQSIFSLLLQNQLHICFRFQEDCIIFRVFLKFLWHQSATSNLPDLSKTYELENLAFGSLTVLSQVKKTYANADLKISLYVCVYLKTVPWKCRILDPENSRVTCPWSL